MTTLSQDSGDASAGTGEPGDEASIGDRRCEGWLGRPAFKITKTSGAVMHAGCCQRMANGDQAPVPWRLSHSVILLAGPAAASSRCRIFTYCILAICNVEGAQIISSAPRRSQY